MVSIIGVKFSKLFVNMQLQNVGHPIVQDCIRMLQVVCANFDVSVFLIAQLLRMISPESGLDTSTVLKKIVWDRGSHHSSSFGYYRRDSRVGGGLTFRRGCRKCL